MWGVTVEFTEVENQTDSEFNNQNNKHEADTRLQKVLFIILLLGAVKIPAPMYIRFLVCKRENSDITLDYNRLY